jgi:cobalt-zinc-cadmium efflux system protein
VARQRRARYTGVVHVHGPATQATQRVLRFSLVFTAAYIVLTLAAGLRAHSMALISESGHNASDFLALLLSLVAVRLEARPASDSKTYGYRRAGVLAAFVNALTLLGLSIWIAAASVERLLHPVPVASRIMMLVAVIGVAMNGAIALLLASVSRDVNLRSSFLHMLGDTLSTAAVIAGGAAILYTHRLWIDPALSLLIATMIFFASFGIVRETLNILLEGAPRGVSLASVRQSMQAISGVASVHDLHVWSLGSNLHALSCHIAIADIPPSESRRILLEVNSTLRERFQIAHTTIQFECLGGEACSAAHQCLLSAESSACFHPGHSH